MIRLLVAGNADVLREEAGLLKEADTFELREYILEVGREERRRRGYTLLDAPET